jgi:hypothetical protein
MPAQNIIVHFIANNFVIQTKIIMRKLYFATSQLLTLSLACFTVAAQITTPRTPSPAADCITNYWYFGCHSELFKAISEKP